jgi:CxxC motif-containing protein
MVASTVRIENSLHPLLPVYTSAPFPKPRIPELLKELRKLDVKAPVQMGQILIKNVLDSGVDVIASRSMTNTQKTIVSTE